jgi:hypothetical protein
MVWVLATSEAERPSSLDAAQRALLAADLVQTLEHAALAHNQNPAARDPLELLFAVYDALGMNAQATAVKNKLAALPASAPAPPEPKMLTVKPGPAYVGVARLRVRQTASASGKKVRELPMGAAVSVVKVEGEWAEVTAEGKNKGGFVAAHYLRATPVTTEALKQEAAALEADGQADPALRAYERVLAWAPGLDDVQQKVAALAIASRQYGPAVRVALKKPDVKVPPGAARPVAHGCDAEIMATRFPNAARYFRETARLREKARDCDAGWMEVVNGFRGIAHAGGKTDRLEALLCDWDRSALMCMAPIAAECEQFGLTVDHVELERLQQEAVLACTTFAGVTAGAASVSTCAAPGVGIPVAFQGEKNARALLWLLGEKGPRFDATAAALRAQLAMARNAPCSCATPQQAREAADRMETEALGVDVSVEGRALVREGVALLRKGWPTTACAVPP